VKEEQEEQWCDGRRRGEVGGFRGLFR